MRNFLVACTLLFFGCSVIAVIAPDEYARLMAVAKEDVQLALDLASKATDKGAPYRARCYTTLLKYAQIPVQTDGIPKPKGIVSLYELAAEADASTQSNPIVPLDVQADCAYIKDQLLKFAGRLGLKTTVPGGGIGADFLK